MIASTSIKLASAQSSAQTVLQRRAIQCSFSSVFYLRNAGGPSKEYVGAERIFTMAVAWPLGLMGLVGGGVFLKREFFGDDR
mmetsp:Transcript_14777/g.31119  ORF Transcript_14777/g.31119 Transcript_14777/m.31119 type:complete len:82 (+) Transcript_14777:149-394(+)